MTRQAFDGVLDYAMLGARTGLETIMDETAGWEKLLMQLRKARRLATPWPTESYIEAYGLYSNPARRRFVQRCRQVVPNLRLSDARQALAGLRMIKQAPEVEAIKQAITITSQTLQDIMAKMSTYTTEYEIEADLSYGFRRRGADGHAFEPIIAGGAKACTLHNVSNDAPLRANQLVVMDVGAEVSHYAADITRTAAYGEPTARQRAVYKSVLEVQKQARELLKPGALLRDYEQQVEKLIGDQLRQLKVTKGRNRDDIRRYYPHAASHFMGLDVHDVGHYDLPLPVGTVLTVEPGIYIPEEGIGVRIEDDVMITENGSRLLSTGLSRVLQ